MVRTWALEERTGQEKAWRALWLGAPGPFLGSWNLSPLGETLSPEGQPQLEGSVLTAPLQFCPFRPQEAHFHIHKWPSDPLIPNLFSW